MASDKTGIKTLWKLPLYKRVLLTMLVIFFCTATACWRFAPFDQWSHSNTLLNLMLSLRTSSLAPLIVISVYVIGGLVIFPVAVLITLSALVLGPLHGFLYSGVGLFANASVFYTLGHLMGYRTVQELSGTRTHQLSQRLSQHGFLTITTLRLLPIAPFTVISLIAGASHLTFRKYIIGTILGITPSLALMTLAGNQLERTAFNPTPENCISAVLVVLLLLVGAWLWHRKKAE